MAGEFTCEECGRTFDSERGMKIHASQMHKDEETEEPDVEQEISGKDVKKDSFTLTIPRPSVNGKAGLIAVLVVGMIAGFAAGQVSPPLGELLQSPAPSKVDVSKIDTSNQPVLGNENANVTVVIYEDFQCPFCQKFEMETIPQIEQNYVETGQVKIVWKDFPLQRIHPWATTASEAMECVYRQDNNAFWTVKNRVFENQKSLNQDNVESNIIDWASEEGVSSDAVRQCLENGNPQQAVMEDLREGQSFEAVVGGNPFISGTPSAVVYREGDEKGEPIVGAQPFQVFKQVIDSKLE